MKYHIVSDYLSDNIKNSFYYTFHYKLCLKVPHIYIYIYIYIIKTLIYTLINNNMKKKEDTVHSSQIRQYKKLPTMLILGVGFTPDEALETSNKT